MAEPIVVQGGRARVPTSQPYILVWDRVAGTPSTATPGARRPEPAPAPSTGATPPSASTAPAPGGEAAPTESAPATPGDPATLEERRYDYFKRLIGETLGAADLMAMRASGGEFSEDVEKAYAQGRIPCSRPRLEFNPNPLAVNVIGIRSMTDWKPHAQSLWMNDDWLVTAWVDEAGKKHCQGFPGSVDPDRKKPDRDVLGTHLCDGQWRYHLIQSKPEDVWKGYGADKPRFGKKTPWGVPLEPFAYWLDRVGASGKEDGVRDAATELYMRADPKKTRIWIHFGSWLGVDKKTGYSAVSHMSAGCQVVHNAKFDEFIGAVENARTNKHNFPYTLLDSAKHLREPIPM